MAKDPAFLFYPGDWLGGTMTMTRHHKGCYIDLLIAQFHQGPLSLETIKVVLGTDQAVWTVLLKKFKQDSEGNFFNERLATEMQKRKKFSDRQAENGKKGGLSKKAKTNPWVPSGLSNNIENENESEDRKEKEGVGEKEKWIMKPVDKELELTEMEVNLTVEFMFFLKKRMLKPVEINNHWTAFKIQYFNGEQTYFSRGRCVQHFRDWLKFQKEDGDQKISGSGGKPGTSQGRLDGLSGLQ